MSEGFFQRRLIRPIVDLLRQGVTPEKIALSVALGVALGVFPVLGSTTALCALAALLLRLNLPAIQLINYFVYPLQIALLIPFFWLGEKLFAAAHIALSVPQIYGMIRADTSHAIVALWTITWHAIVAWCFLAPILVALVYGSLAPLLRRVWRRRTAEAAGTTQEWR